MAISRILFPASLRGDDHLSHPPWRTPATLARRMMRRYPGIISGPAVLPLFCLAPHGVFRASRIAPRAVSSYLAISPLPVLFSKNRRCVFCDTFRQQPLSQILPAYFTRHAAVWCSDFPPASPASAGSTGDHLPSAHNVAQKQKSGSQRAMNFGRTNAGRALRRRRFWNAVS